MTPTMVGRAAAVAAAAAAAPIIECPICGEVSEQPYKNYGTKACYSCRAFFRRAHQKTRTPNFICRKRKSAASSSSSSSAPPKFLSPCQVTVKTRRQCQKCRYDRCLSAGMRPELVMSEEQKRVRFRNVAFGGGGNGGEEQDPQPVPVGAGHEDLLLSAPQYWPQQQQQQQQQQDQHRHQAAPFQDDLMDLLSTFEEQQQQEQQQGPSSRNNSESDNSEEGGGDQLVHVEYSNNTAPEAEQQDSFASEQQDQDEKFGWLFSTFNSVSVDGEQEEDAVMEPISIEYVGEATPAQPFGQDQTPDELKEQQDQAPAEQQVAQHDQDDLLDLTVYEEGDIPSPSKYQEFPLVSSLSSSIPVELNSIPDEIWEDACLERQAACLLSKTASSAPSSIDGVCGPAFSSTSTFGEDFIREYVMYSFDVPLSKSFVPGFVRGIGEEFRRSLVGGAIPEFSSLRSEEQASFLRSSNLFSAVALRVARVCNCPDARSQLAEIFGHALSNYDAENREEEAMMSSGAEAAGDAEIWRAKFSSVVKVDKLHKLKMPIINEQTGLFRDDEDSLDRYLRLVARLRWAVRDEKVFRALVVVTLFSGDISVRHSSLSGLYHRYRAMLLRQADRRVKWRRESEAEIDIGVRASKRIISIDEDSEHEEEENDFARIDEDDCVVPPKAARIQDEDQEEEVFFSEHPQQQQQHNYVPSDFTNCLSDAAELGDILRRLATRRRTRALSPSGREETTAMITV